jgi:hypothetical protein
LMKTGEGKHNDKSVGREAPCENSG